MPRISSLEKAKSKVLQHFKTLRQTIFTPSDLTSILDEYRHTWNISPSTQPIAFIRFLKEKEVLRSRSIILKFPNDRNYPRHVRQQFSDFELALSLVNKSYLSHYSAMKHHQLTEQLPTTIYVNKEQTPKPQSKSSLSQESMNRAFRNNPRMSNNIGIFDDKKIMILSGKFTKNHGVIKSKEGFLVTNIERTLIDAVVRPVYSGGIHEVFKAYQIGYGKFSVNKLMATLKPLDFVYPYHQSIGFLLEKAGASESELKLIEKSPKDFDFYLTHKMDQTSYSERWKLFYPKSLDGLS